MTVENATRIEFVLCFFPIRNLSKIILLKLSILSISTTSHKRVKFSQRFQCPTSIQDDTVTNSCSLCRKLGSKLRQVHHRFTYRPPDAPSILRVSLSIIEPFVERFCQLFPCPAFLGRVDSDQGGVLTYWFYSWIRSGLSRSKFLFLFFSNNLVEVIHRSFRFSPHARNSFSRTDFQNNKSLRFNCVF